MQNIAKRARRLPDVPDLMLPGGFAFGAATSAYQVEGATSQDGRGPSIWEPFLRKPRTPPYDLGDVACDHYNRYREDVALMRSMGLKAYRFSISWSRVMPDGEGKVNRQGLDFYDRLVDELWANGIEPYATLYHWDLPLALQQRYHGWLSRETAMRFADYAAVMARRLGDRVRKFATLNEPEVIIAGYISDGMAPGVNLPHSRYPVGHHLMLGHGVAVQAIRAARSGTECGIVLNLVPIEAQTPAAKEEAHRFWERNYSWYLDGLLNGYYPDSILPELEGKSLGGPHLKPLDMALIAQKLDFLGINYYTRFVCNEKGGLVETPGAARTQMGWEMVPSALTDMLVDLNETYELPPVYITENGAALDDVVTRGRIRDTGRIQYLDSHLKAVAAATARGVDVRGYFVWSLMDNLEWPLGFAKTFGLIHVDRATLKRTVKDSGHWYAKVIEKNDLPLK